MKYCGEKMSIPFLLGITTGFVAIIYITTMSNSISATIATPQFIVNERPIIGILAQEAYSVENYIPNKTYKSFIAASYVKYVESAGARVVPIMIGQDDKYYKELTDSLNGLLFPGGATFFNESGGYADAGKLLYRLAKNKQLPVLGICLGMELIVYAEANGTDLRSACESFNQALPLDFKSDFKTSRIFGEATNDIIKILENENVTYNYHRYCVTEEDFSKMGLSENDWHILSVNKDKNGLEFISSFESRKLPIYGLQFHPEKNIFEWKKNRNIPHTKNAVRIAQFFVDNFVNEARKSSNSFANEEKERSMLIYNYNVFYCGKNEKCPYEQLYLFQ